MKRSAKMKRKILCLAICVACILTAFASCGKNADCDAHVDADKNSACDNCGIPVFTVVEKVPAEEELVDMVVSAIPENVKVSDVFVIKGETNEVIPVNVTTDENVNKNTISSISGSDYLLVRYTEQTAGVDTEEDDTDDTFKRTTRIINPYTGADVLPAFVVSYDNDDVQSRLDSIAYSIVNGAMICATTTTWQLREGYSNEYDKVDSVAYYALNGTKIADEKDAVRDEDGYYDFEFDLVGVTEDILYVGKTCGGGIQSMEHHPRLTGDYLRRRGLTRTGRAVKYHIGNTTGLYHFTYHALLTEKVSLTHYIVKATGAQCLGQPYVLHFSSLKVFLFTSPKKAYLPTR